MSRINCPLHPIRKSEIRRFLCNHSPHPFIDTPTNSSSTIAAFGSEDLPCTRVRVVFIADEECLVQGPWEASSSSRGPIPIHSESTSPGLGIYGDTPSRTHGLRGRSDRVCIIGPVAKAPPPLELHFLRRGPVHRRREKCCSCLHAIHGDAYLVDISSHSCQDRRSHRVP